MTAVETFAEITIRIFPAGPDGRHPVEISAPGRQPPAGIVGPPPTGLPGLDPAADSRRLTDWLFTDANLKAAWAELRGRAPRRRIRLRIDSTAPALHRLPWELLAEVDLGGQPHLLGATDATPFSRYLAGGWEPGAPVMEAPVRMLVAIADPDFAASSFPLTPIDADGEWKMLQEATFAPQGAGLLELARLPSPCTLTSLETALRDGFHILHFLGHGAYSEASQKAVVFMADAANQTALVPDIEFRDMVSRLLPAGGNHAKPGLRLVFLASCQTATRSDADAFAGFAPQLVQGSVPAVLAMQDKVAMDTARAFAQVFYRELLAHGLVDLACNQARAHLLTGSYTGAQVPVLFSRLPDNRLLDLPAGDRRPVIERQTFEPETIYVPAGAFRIGRDPGPNVPAVETPAARITLAAYRIGRYPVTNAEYLHFVRATGRAVANDTGWILAAVGQQPPAGKEDHPVRGVTWDDVVAYCEWLEQTTRRRYRLPSEAEWEVAARGSDDRLYPWGGDFDATRCNAQPSGIGATTPVGQFSPAGDSPRRCADMAGNVWEWTNTRWGRETAVAEYAYPYKVDDGRENSAPLAPFRELRICRGGSFADGAERVTCTARARYDAGSRHARRGFRVAMSV